MNSKGNHKTLEIIFDAFIKLTTIVMLNFILSFFNNIQIWLERRVTWQRSS